MTNSSNHHQLHPHNMQLTLPHNQATIPSSSALEAPVTPSAAAEEESRGRRKGHVASSSPGGGRPRPRCTCSSHPGSTTCSRHGYMVPRQSMMMRRYSNSANKEILRRALTPPNRKMTLRWWNFRPTPSRLSNMSMA